MVWFRQSLTLYCFVLFSEVLTTGDPKPGPGNTSEGWEFFFFWLGFFVRVPFFFSPQADCLIKNLLLFVLQFCSSR